MEFPRGGLIGRCVALARQLRKMEIPEHAAYAGYFMILAVFPALVLLLSVMRYTRLDAGDLMQLLSPYIPRALTSAVEKLVIQTYAYSGAGIVSVSAVGALWSASRGIYGILRGLNAVYGVEENRGWFHTRAVSMVYTFAFLVVLLLSLAMRFFGGEILELLPIGTELLQFVIRILDLRFVLLLTVQAVLFAAMYTVMPNRTGRFRENLPGAVLVSLGWMVFSNLFSAYVEHFSAYSNIYGSVYAVALGMLWLYCCLCILFFGAALNRLAGEKG